MELSLIKNIGKIDKIIRVSIGIILMTLVFTKKLRGCKATGASVISAFQFISAISNYCILYDLLGISTKKYD